VLSSQGASWHLRRIAQLAGLRERVDMVTIEAGKVVKRQRPLHELVSTRSTK